MKLGLNVSLSAEEKKKRGKNKKQSFGHSHCRRFIVGVCLSLALSSRAVNLSVTANLHCVNLKYSIYPFANFI